MGFLSIIGAFDDSKEINLGHEMAIMRDQTGSKDRPPPPFPRALATYFAARRVREAVRGTAPLTDFTTPTVRTER
jgi:hypothetical protein